MIHFYQCTPEAAQCGLRGEPASSRAGQLCAVLAKVLSQVLLGLAVLPRLVQVVDGLPKAHIGSQEQYLCAPALIAPCH